MTSDIEIINPYQAPIVLSDAIRVGDHVLGGGDLTMARRHGQTYHANLPHSIFRTEKINRKSLLLKDLQTSHLYTLNKQQWGNAKMVELRLLPCSGF